MDLKSTLRISHQPNHRLMHAEAAQSWYQLFVRLILSQKCLVGLELPLFPVVVAEVQIDGFTLKAAG